MKRLIMMLTPFLLLLFCSVGYASMLHGGAAQKIGVVIISSPDYKTQNIYEYFYGQLRSETDSGYTVEVGNEPQNKWVEYWLNQGFLEEQQPKKDDLLKFVEASGYDKVIYFFVKDPIVEKHTRQTGLFSSSTQSRASVTVNSFLCDKKGVLKTYSVSKQDDSEWSDMRAKIGALKKCARDIGKEVKSYFSNKN